MLPATRGWRLEALGRSVGRRVVRQNEKDLGHLPGEFVGSDVISDLERKIKQMHNLAKLIRKLKT